MRLAALSVLLFWASTASASVPESLTAAGKPVSVNVENKHIFGMQWRQPVVRTGAFRTVGESLGVPAPIPETNQIIVATGEGEVRSYDMVTGEMQWRSRFEADFEAAVTPFKNADGTLLGFVVDRNGNARALDMKTGKAVWTVGIGSDSRAPIVVHGNLILVTTVQNKILALNKEDGKILWSKGRGKPAGLTIVGHGSPVVGEGVVYASFSDGYLGAYDLVKGTTLWERPLSLSEADFIDANATPVLHQGILYGASYSEGIFALDPKTGNILWNKPAPAVTSLTVGDNQLFAGSADGYIWGLNLADGKMAFRTRLIEGPALGVQYAQGYLILSGGESGFIVLSAVNGAPLQATALGSRAASAPAINGSEIALLTTGGYLYSFSSRKAE